MTKEKNKKKSAFFACTLGFMGNWVQGDGTGVRCYRIRAKTRIAFTSGFEQGFADSALS
jgi:hypothetical protein